MNPNTIRTVYYPDNWTVREFMDGPTQFFEVLNGDDCYVITSLIWLSYAIKTNTNRSQTENGPNIRKGWKLLYEYLMVYHEYLFDGEKG
jgi:hypothetical protein